jgi:Family of unknown function (DUF6049)
VSRFWARHAKLAAPAIALVLALSPAAAAGASVFPGAAASVHSASPLPPTAIKIVPGSTIHLVSRNSKLPVSIQNNFPTEIRVQVHVAPTNLSALIPAAIEVTVPANTTYVAQVPVTAIADGTVALHAWLTTFSGLSLGDPVILNLTINAEVEDSLIGGFAIAVAALLVIGVVRTVRKRRQKVAG